MLHIKLDYSAFLLSKHSNSFTSSALLWAGDKQQAVLVFDPIKHIACFTEEELWAFVHTVPSLHNHAQADDKAAPADKGWHSFRSGWLGYFSYEAGNVLVTGVNRTVDMPLAELSEYAFSLVLDFNSDECELYYREGVNFEAVLQDRKSVV